MPRSKRIVVPGLPHHITHRGNRPSEGLRQRSGPHRVPRSDGADSRQYGLAVWGYCLMPNHFHIIGVPADEGTTAKVLCRLEADYARFLSVRRGTSGHLWQARYYSVPMEAAYSWRALAYVERNPVRAGMTGQPEWAWGWSRRGSIFTSGPNTGTDGSGCRCWPMKAATR